MVVVAIDLQRTIDLVYEHTDRAEINKMGSFARDPVFLKEISNMMDHGMRNKKDILYLMKISSKIQVQTCHWVIFISYTFPVLEPTNFIPHKVLSMPKQIKGKFFVLSELPYVITWGSKVFSFSEREFNDCDHYNDHIFCRMPTHVKNLLDSCLYGIVHNTPWKRLASKCPLTYKENPLEMVQFTESHMIYFFMKPKYATVICEAYSKPLTLEGSGVVEVPTGCQIKYGDTTSFSLGHIARSNHLTFNIDNKVWHSNFSATLPLFTVTNVKNISSLWLETSQEEKIVEEGLSDVHKLMKFMHFSPTTVHYTIWSLIFYTIIATILLIVILYCICVPGAVISCKKCCCCCRSKNQKSINIKDI